MHFTAVMFLNLSAYHNLIQYLIAHQIIDCQVLCVYNVKFSLCLIKDPAIKTYPGVEIQLHGHLTTALHVGEWSASLPIRFIPQKTNHDTVWM
jgi:hypothetical protein